jgi:hypothetical protein
MANPSRPRKYRRGHFLRLQRLAHWQKLWTDDPDRMEAIRRAATTAASKAKKQRNDNLRQIVASDFPAQMTPPEFRQLTTDLAAQVVRPKGRKPYQPDSLRRRLTTKGFVRYDAALGLYINLTLI